MSTTPDETPVHARERRLGKQLLPILLIAILLLFGLELGVRVLSRAGYLPEVERLSRDYDRLVQQGPDWIRFVSDPELGYRLRPEFTLAASTGSGKTVHNADGFRDRDPFPPKSSAVLRVACFGGSTTYGVAVADNEESYPAQLENVLREKVRLLGWRDVEVFNLGVGGYNSREILGTMQRMVPLLEPDVVLIQNAINDVVPRFYPDFNADYSHFRTPFAPLNPSLWHSVAYRSKAWLALAHGLGWIKPLSLQSQTQLPMPLVDDALANLEKNPTTAFEENQRACIALALAANAQVWLLTQPYLDVPAFSGPNETSRKLEGGYRRGLAENTAVVIGLAEKMKVGLVPLHETMPRQRELFSDPIHMSADGNRVKAEKISEVISESLPKPTE